MSHVTCEFRDGVCWIAFNRPEKLNAITREMRAEMLRCLQEAERRDDVRAVVLRGVGRAFSSGTDVGYIRSASSGSPVEMERAERGIWYTDIVRFMWGMSKPVIAMVHGYCAGGGMELVMYCDLAYASADAVFFLGETNLGLIPASGGTQMLPRLIGDKRAREAVYFARRLTAQEAKQLGLVNDVCPPEKLEECVMRAVEEIKQRSPVAIALAKRAINAAYDLPISQGLEYERELAFKAVFTEDAKEGVAAFLEKRRPVFGRHN